MSAPVLLLHGFTGGPSAWDRVVATLGEPVVAPRLLGHGAPLGGTTFDEEADRLAALAPRGACLVGYSLGGRLALRMLVRHPGRWRAAVLVGARDGLRDPAERDARRRADARWIHLLESEGIEAFCRAWEALPLWASQRRLPPEVRRAQADLRRAHDARGLAASLRVLGLAEMPASGDAELAAIHTPVTLLCGSMDDKFLALGEALARRLPSADLRRVSGAGHNVVLERPGAVAAAISAASAAGACGGGAPST